MGFPTPAFLFFLLIFGTFSLNVFALVGGQGGAWGYSQFPSASQMPAGNFTLYSEIQGSSLSSKNSGVIYSPLSLLEMGAVLRQDSTKNTGILSFKIQIPRIDTWQPLLSMGVQDLAMDDRRWENLYFVGGYALNSGDMTLYLDLGAIYHRHRTSSRNRVTAFFAGEFDFGFGSLMMETSRSDQGIGLIPSLWIKPANRTLYLGGGMNWLSSEPKVFDNFWGEAGVQIPLGSHKETSTNPWFYIDLNPSGDYFLSASEKQYQTYLDLQVALRTAIPGLFWVNGASIDVAHSERRNSLARHNVWDRSYVLFDLNKEWGKRFLVHAPEAGTGMLMENIIGAFLNQKLRHRSWNPLSIDLAIYRGKQNGNEATLRLPLHPRGPSFIKWVQLYGEGGKYLFEGPQFFGGIKIGGRHSFVDGAVGYRVEEKQVVARVDLRLDLSRWSKRQVGPILIRGFNRVEHHFSLNANDLDAEEFEPSLLSNPQSHLSHFPWTPIEGKPNGIRNPDRVQRERDLDSDGILDSWDNCPEIPEDKDAYQDQDGCPELDNDSDRIIDSLDKCPFEAEDEDLFRDDDGCPELDNDLDGVPDSLDACVLSPEDLDSYLDADGCPDPDNDHDGIRDGDDACPNQAGSYFPGNLRNGCPEGDDNDGIPFDQDACPNSPEDYDGFQDTDGCPDP